MFYNWGLNNALLSFLKRFSPQYNVETQVKLQVLVFNIVYRVVEEFRRVKLNSCQACAEKRQKYKLVPRLLSMIVGKL